MFSNDPIKDKAIKNIVRSTSKEQLENSKRFADLAGLLDDDLVKEWLDFKLAISNFNSPF